MAENTQMNENERGLFSLNGITGYLIAVVLLLSILGFLTFSAITTQQANATNYYKINQDLKDAMKAGDKVRLQTIRSLRALILEFEKSGANREMNEEDEIKLLTSAAKKRKESIEQYTKGGREELAAKEAEELKIIETYLPKQLTEDEIKEVVRNLAAELKVEGKKDFGKLMGASAKALKGKADGNVIRGIVESILS
jgi:uncharacterized protein YqeY